MSKSGVVYMEAWFHNRRKKYKIIATFMSKCRVFRAYVSQLQVDILQYNILQFWIFFVRIVALYLAVFTYKFIYIADGKKVRTDRYEIKIARKTLENSNKLKDIDSELWDTNKQILNINSEFRDANSKLWGINSVLQNINSKLIDLCSEFKKVKKSEL